MMKIAKTSKARLDKANIQLGKELLSIKSSLAIYTVIGLNAKIIKCGKNFFGFIQNQSLGAAALGLAKVFEREETDNETTVHELCSIRGVYRLAKGVKIHDLAAVRAFAQKYGISVSDDWSRDVEEVLTAQRPRIKSSMKMIDRIRNTRLAHVQQNAPVGNLPSIALSSTCLVLPSTFIRSSIQRF
jgi:hypothetical protein